MEGRATSGSGSGSGWQAATPWRDGVVERRNSAPYDITTAPHFAELDRRFQEDGSARRALRNSMERREAATAKEQEAAAREQEADTVRSASMDGAPAERWAKVSEGDRRRFDETVAALEAAGLPDAALWRARYDATDPARGHGDSVQLQPFLFMLSEVSMIARQLPEVGQQAASDPQKQAAVEARIKGLATMLADPSTSPDDLREMWKAVLATTRA